MNSPKSHQGFIPRTFSGYHCVGWVKSAHGLRGELYVQLYAGTADWLNSLREIFLLRPNENALSGWSLVKASPHKEGLILSLNNCTDRNQSEGLRKSGVYIPESLMTSAPGETIFLKQILHFSVYDYHAMRLGQIVGFGTNGVQDLLRVKLENGGQEALIPFVDAFIVHIDFDKQQLKMDLPEGLLDLEEK